MLNCVLSFFPSMFQVSSRYKRRQNTEISYQRNAVVSILIFSPSIFMSAFILLFCCFYSFPHQPYSSLFLFFCSNKESTSCIVIPNTPEASISNAYIGIEAEAIHFVHAHY